jgi:hypothetical protein
MFEVVHLEICSLRAPAMQWGELGQWVLSDNLLVVQYWLLQQHG